MPQFHVFFKKFASDSKSQRYIITADNRDEVANKELSKHMFEEGHDIVRIQEIKPATTKQVVAQAYGMIMGSIKGAKVQWNRARTNIILSAGVNAVKAERANNLVDMQFTKLERDLRDLFKLAGLKVK
jgi:hypothetical protein